MSPTTESLFQRVAGPLTLINERLAVGRCPSCGTEKSLFIDLKTGTWRCGRLPSSLSDGDPSTEPDPRVKHSPEGLQ
jgi:hypothetical protein